MCAAGLVGDPPAAEASVAVAKSDFVGVYRLVDSADKKAEIRKIIDVATDDMPVLQSIARKRLYETTEPLPLLVIGFPDDRISIGYLGERPIVTPDGGEPVKWRNRLGDKAAVRQQFASGTIVQRYSGAMGGKRKSVYRLSTDGNTITVHTAVTADIMPKPVVFKTTYVRKS